MYKIETHPILDIPQSEMVEFVYDEKKRNAVIETIFKGFPLNVMYWAKKMKAKVTKISFKNMSSKFAYYSYPSCKVTFSLFVLAFDLNTIDYLIIHELSHYFYQDHSANF